MCQLSVLSCEPGLILGISWAETTHWLYGCLCGDVISWPEEGSLMRFSIHQLHGSSSRTVRGSRRSKFLTRRSIERFASGVRAEDFQSDSVGFQLLHHLLDLGLLHMAFEVEEEEVAGFRSP